MKNSQLTRSFLRRQSACGPHKRRITPAPRPDVNTMPILWWMTHSILRSPLSWQCSGNYAFVGPIDPLVTWPHSLCIGMGGSAITWRTIDIRLVQRACSFHRTANLGVNRVEPAYETAGKHFTNTCQLVQHPCIAKCDGVKPISIACHMNQFQRLNASDISVSPLNFGQGIRDRKLARISATQINCCKNWKYFLLQIIELCKW